MKPTSSGRRGLLALSAFTFFLMFAVGLATPIVPLYAASLGASWTQLGLMGTTWGVTFLFLAILVGRISDKVGRRPVLLASGILSAVAASLYMISNSVLQIILIRIFEGAAWALFWPTIEAFATELVEAKRAAQAIGIVSASYGTAFAAASLAAGSITQSLGYGETFAAYLMLALVSIAIAVTLLPRHKQYSIVGSVAEQNAAFSGLKSPQVVLADVLGGSYTFGLGVVLTLLPVFAKSIGVAIFLIGVVFGTFWVGRIIGASRAGRLSEKHGKNLVAFIAMIGCSLGFVIMAASGGAVELFVAAIVLGLSVGAVFPVTIAMISDNVPQSVRGVAMGIYETSCAAGFMLAAITGGLLADLFSPRIPYFAAAGVCLASAGLFMARRKRLTKI